MTRAEWVEKAEGQLLAVLFRGYHTKETDPAMLFRRETNDAERLHDLLGRLYDLAQPKPLNGRATDPTAKQGGSP